MKVVKQYFRRTGKRIAEGKMLCIDAWRWLRIWKTLPVYSWLKAAGAFRSGKYHESAVYYQRGLDKYSEHPAHFSARFDLAYCLEKTGSYEEAIKVLSDITSERHPFLDSFVSKATLEHYLGRNAAALETIRLGLSMFPDSSKLICKFIHISLTSGLYQNEIPVLIEELKAMISQDHPDRAEIYVAMAHYELVLGDAILGDRILIKSLSNDEIPVDAYLIRGKRLFSHGKILQARELFRRAMILSPGNPYPLMLLGETYLVSDIPEEIHWAIQLAESAGRISKWKNLEAVELLGRAYEKNKEQEKAELFLEKIRHMSQAAYIPFRKKGRDLMLRS
jgi:tetratricopeptide (TPR) repeat protein